MAQPQLEKVYDPNWVEDKWYQHWLDQNYFHVEPDPQKEPYTVVIPPPNITGMLTMGHVLNNTIQDILIRKARMEGKQACWIPGTDHASIATETKVVDMLMDQGIKKDSLSRKEFVDHAWQWKDKYGLQSEMVTGIGSPSARVLVDQYHLIISDQVVHVLFE